METILPAPPTRTITLRPDLYDTLLLIAAREGKNVESVADEILTKNLHHNGEEKQTAAKEVRSWREVLAPLQAAFEATGMTDHELGDFIDSEIAAHRREKAQANG